jgi:hypothetical protein
MDRINHVKIVSPDPAAIDRFLREVVDIPAGWPLGPAVPAPGTAIRSEARDEAGEFTRESLGAYRGNASFDGGLVTGSTESRQFQLLKGDTPRIWAVAIGTRHLERAHQRCVERGIPCTDPAVTPWGDGTVTFFFAEVAGVVFEVMRAGQADAG